MRSVKTVAAASALLMLAGCANVGPGQAIGAGAGGVTGYAVGTALGAGPAGRAIGAVVGAGLGQGMGQSVDQQNRAAHSQSWQHGQHGYGHTPAYSTYEECTQFSPGPVRVSCERGVQRRIYEEQRRQENAAFRQGYGR